MYVVLGLHFGHDASVTVLVDGGIGSFVQRERLCRIKHAYSLDRESLDTALKRAGVSVKQIDAVAVTSTQGCEPILAKLEGLSLSYDGSMAIGHPALLANTLGVSSSDIIKKCAPSMVERVLGYPPDPRVHPAFRHYFAEYQHIPFDKLRRFPWLDAHVDLPDWRYPRGIDTLSCIDVDKRLADPAGQWGFHYPLRVELDGCVLPGVRVDHHLAHAASSFLRSGSSEALIVTNDGYGGRRTPFSNGGVYLGRENRISALAPHFLTHGHLFDWVARHLGLSAIGGPGKLMGLAPYGSPDYFAYYFVGDYLDLNAAGITDLPTAWLVHGQERGRQLGHSEQVLVAPHLPFSTFQLNFAASTQLLFEETWLALIRAARESLAKAKIEPDTLCISGGAALNCPANTRMAKEGGFSRLFIEPNCDDSGLSTGAAMWTFHCLLGHRVRRDRSFSASEVYGYSYSHGQLCAALRLYKGTLRVERPPEPALAAANDLFRGKIVAWFEGGSEMGPRALGHRSVLGDPRLREMHYAVNAVKQREFWRPLAPMVLEERLADYFEWNGQRIDSPFMLFTMRVCNAELRAVTHVDGSARVQTVSEKNGIIYEVLRYFEKLSGIPVLLNTSMNGPGEPIAETPEDAIRFFLRANVDVLYLDGLRVVHGNSTTIP